MSKDKPASASHFEVADADEAFRKAEDFGRRLMAAPKKPGKKQTARTRKRRN
jgi:hypothetical protein